MATFIDIHWYEFEYKEFFGNPAGELGRELFSVLAQTVLAGARRRVLIKTGKMRDDMTWSVGADEYGLYAEVTSPVLSKAGFPYASVHEGKKVRDRRPHRSLIPALKDVRNVLKA